MAKALPKFKAAAMHVAPVFMDTQATVDKACALIKEAAKHGARLIAFPETYIPAFPIWSAVRAPIENHEFFQRLTQAAIRVPGPEIAQLAECARAHQVFVSIGVNEGTEASLGCIWNSNILIGDDGSLLNHHRKLVPTFFEKMVWAPGDARGLKVTDTAVGRVGMLICGENTNPLARYALIAQGEQVHISSYPPIWPTRPPGQPGAYDIESAIRIRAGAHSFEGKVFNIVASAFWDKKTRDAIVKGDAKVAAIVDNTPRSVSIVLGPDGMPVSETMRDEEGILYADIDVAKCVEPKQFHDVAGYYNRFDVFGLSVDRTHRDPATFADMPETPSPENNALRQEPRGEVPARKKAPARRKKV
ncbi:MAG: carbon-nitrogen hydrolase family protein [Proteobacteria bacterium]|nr:carbon-nitrogen hydrolase family protein [Pseudomonadota bacterium]